MESNEQEEYFQIKANCTGTILDVFIKPNKYIGKNTCIANIIPNIKIDSLDEYCSMADNIESEDMKDIKSPFAGIVTKIYIKQFSFVMQGDILAEIKLPDTSLSIKQNEKRIEESKLYLQWRMFLNIGIVISLFTALVPLFLFLSLIRIIFRCKMGSKKKIMLDIEIAQQNIEKHQKQLKTNSGNDDTSKGENLYAANIAIHENNINEYNKILSFSKKLKIILFVLLLVGLFTLLIFPNLSFSLYHYSISNFIDTIGALAFSISGLIVFMLFMSRLKNGGKKEIVLKKQVAEENIILNKRKLYAENITYEYDEIVDAEEKEDNLDIEIYIDEENCKCCNLCALTCPKVAIEADEDCETPPYINEDKCNKCIQCLSSCPYGLIYTEKIEE